MRPRRMVDAVCTAEGRVEETTTQVLIDGNIQILEGETSLYSDVRYTLHLEDKRLRSCDFYAEPIDVVAGMYRIEGSGNFRKPYRRQSPT
jgi:hypothetical protein